MLALVTTHRQLFSIVTSPGHLIALIYNYHWSDSQTTRVCSKMRFVKMELVFVIRTRNWLILLVKVLEIVQNMHFVIKKYAFAIHIMWELNARPTNAIL